MPTRHHHCSPHHCCRRIIVRGCSIDCTLSHSQHWRQSRHHCHHRPTILVISPSSIRFCWGNGPRRHCNFVYTERRFTIAYGTNDGVVGKGTAAGTINSSSSGRGWGRHDRGETGAGIMGEDMPIGGEVIGTAGAIGKLFFLIHLYWLIFSYLFWQGRLLR